MKKIVLSPFLTVIVVWIFFSFPFFFQDKVPFPSSYQVNFFAPWNAYPEFASPYKNEATPDVIGQIYPWRDFTINTWKSGQIPLWNPYSFSGTFHLANYQSAVFSPLNMGFFVFPFVEWWSVLILLQPLLAGVFVLFYTRSLKFSWSAQILSSVSFMFCGFITTWMMYGTLAYAILFLPLALFSIEKFIETNKIRYALLLFITIPLSFFSGHFQVSLYFLIFTIYYLVLRSYQTKSTDIVMFSAVFFGLLASSVQLFPSIEAYSQSLRSGIFQTIETIPWVYFPTFLAPDFFGNPVTRNAWFGHYAEWNAFIGIVPLFFAFYSFFRVKKREIYIFVIPLFLSLLLAFPSPLLELLVFLKIPVLSTSAASRIIVLYSFSAAILAGYGFMNFLDDIKIRNYKKTVLLVFLFALFFVSLWGIVLFKAFLQPDKISIAFSNLRFPTAIFVSFMGVVAVFITIKKTFIRNVLVFLFLLLSVFDILRFATKWQPFDPKNLVFADTKVSQFYKNLPDSKARVFKNSGAEGTMFNKRLSTEGYDAVYINRYGEFISSLRTGELDTSARSVVAFPKDSPYATQAANFLGIKYIIHKVSDGQNVWEFPFWKYNPETLKLLYDDNYYQILENSNAFPRAFLINKIIIEEDPQEILDIMLSPETNLLKTAIIEERIEIPINLSTGSAEIISYTPNVIDIQTNSDANSFLVLTDAYSSGWNAYINEKKTKIYRTDFAFRGIFVPSGKNNITFQYEPKSFYYGAIASLIGIFGIVILSFLRRKK